MNKFKIAWRAIFKIRNLPVYFLDYFKLISGVYAVYKLKNGIVFKIRAATQDNTIFNQIWLKGVYEFPGFDIGEKDIVFDIGAQAGFFSAWAAKKAKKGKIYAFEPEPQNFALLKENIEMNDLKNIMLFNKAVSNASGEREFIVYPKAVGAHSFVYSTPDENFKKINVEAISLEEIMKKENISQIDFLKMDCEGAEYEILFNLSENIFGSIKKIAMEYHDMDVERNSLKMKEFLEKMGFKVILGNKGDNMLYAIRL